MRDMIEYSGNSWCLSRYTTVELVSGQDHLLLTLADKDDLPRPAGVNGVNGVNGVPAHQVRRFLEILHKQEGNIDT